MRNLVPLVAVLTLSACAGAQIEKLKAENQALSERAGALLVQAKEKSDAADAVAAAKAELEGRLSDAEGKLAIANARIESLTKSNDDLISASGASQTELGGKLSALVAEKDGLSKKLAEAQKEKITLERTKNIYRSARDKAAAELAKLAPEKAQLAVQLAVYQREEAVRKAAADEAAAERAGQLGGVADVILKEIQAGKAWAAVSGKFLMFKLNDSILFEGDTAKLSDAGAELLGRVGRALKALGAREIQVSARNDARPIKRGLLGGYEDHWALSAAQAAAATRALHLHAGLDPEHLSAVGYGEFRALPANDDACPDSRCVVIAVEPVATP